MEVVQVLSLAVSEWRSRFPEEHPIQVHKMLTLVAPLVRQCVPMVSVFLRVRSMLVSLFLLAHSRLTDGGTEAVLLPNQEQPHPLLVLQA